MFQNNRNYKVNITKMQVFIQKNSTVEEERTDSLY